MHHTVKWADGPPPPATLPKYRLAVAKDCRGLVAYLTGQRLTGAYTHWLGASKERPRGRRVPCLAERCELCGNGYLGLRYWWISCTVGASAAGRILELSEGAAVQLAALAPDPHSLRGLSVHVRRADVRTCSPQLVSLVERPDPLPYALPEGADVQPHLLRFWGLATVPWSSNLPDWTPRGRAGGVQVRRATP